MSLHPDKIAALEYIASGGSTPEREPVKSSTIEQRAINAAKTRQIQALPKEPGVIDELAFDMRGAHYANHLNRLKKAIGARANNQPQRPVQTPPPQGVTIVLPGGNRG